MAAIALLNPPHPAGKGFTREGRCTQESGVWATQWPPLTLATCASMLDADQHRLLVLDCPAVGISREELLSRLTVFQPEFVFLSTATATLEQDLDLARSLKAMSWEIITAVLGTHVSVRPEEALARPGLDLVIRREPEATVRELCSRNRAEWPLIPGISYRDRDKVCHNTDRPFLGQDSIPVPAWQHLDLSPYRLPLVGRSFLILAPLRGCPYACSFCTAPVYYGRKIRKRPVQTVVDEIQANLQHFHIRDFFIWADTFTADTVYVKAFCREILSRGLDIAWTCNSRVDTVDEETLVLMKQAGLWMISFGLESGSDSVLKNSGKGITVQHSRKAVSLAQAAGIKISGHFVLGLPGETRQTLRQTLSLALELPLDIAQFYAAAPFPGTSLESLAREKGWLHPGRCPSQQGSSLELPGLPSSAVDNFRRHCYKRFYLRPATLFNLFRLFKIKALGGSLSSMIRFIRWILQLNLSGSRSS